MPISNSYFGVLHPNYLRTRLFVDGGGLYKGNKEVIKVGPNTIGLMSLQRKVLDTGKKPCEDDDKSL